MIFGAVSYSKTSNRTTLNVVFSLFFIYIFLQRHNIARLELKMPENIRQRRRHAAGRQSTSNCGETGQLSTEDVLMPLYVITESVFSLWSFEGEIVGDVVGDIRKTRRSGWPDHWYVLFTDADIIIKKLNVFKATYFICNLAYSMNHRYRQVFKFQLLINFNYYWILKSSCKSSSQA